MRKDTETRKKQDEAAQSTTPKKKDGFSAKKVTAVVCVIAIVAVLAAGFLVYAATYEDVLHGVYISGVEVGGMNQDAAANKIEEAFAPEVKDRKITFKCGDNSEVVFLSDIDARVDSEKMAETAFLEGRSNGFLGKAFALAASVFKKREIPLSVEVNNSAFEAVISRVAGEFETLMTETDYELNGTTLTIVKGEPGEMVNREKALGLLSAAVADSDASEIELSVERAEPKEVDLDEFYTALTAPAADAEYKLEDGNVIIIPHKVGITVSKKEIAKALESKEKRYSLEVAVDEPEVTAGELKSLLFRDVMGTYSSNFSTSTEARASNVILTAQRINGYVLMPGDVFSYDKTVGSRTVANGYKSAGVYVGNKVESGIGGGICQTSSTLYSAALYANLEIVERTSHSLPVSYVPGGMDATIAEGYIDLKLRNNTDYPVKIVAVVNGRNLTCKILGVKKEGQSVEVVNTITGSIAPKIDVVGDETIPQGYKKVRSKGAAGFTVSSKRIVSVNGKVVKEEKLTNSVYNATNSEVAVNPADTGASVDALAVYNEEQYKKEQEEKLKLEEQQNAEGTATGSEAVSGTVAETVTVPEI